MKTVFVSRRSFLKLNGAVIAQLFIAASIVSAAEVPKQPNIVFILVDDLGQHQLSSYGSKFYETPTIDRLAKEGMRFTNAYAACPVCSPTRASIMTGKYPARLHLTDFLGGARERKDTTDRKLSILNWQKSLPLEEITVAESLKSAGYATGHFGKWHLNGDKNYKPGRPGDPGSQGFDDVLTTHKPRAGPESKYTNDWHHVREITERATAFMEQNRDQPFFCYVSYNSIHAPEIEKKSLIEKYANKSDSGPGERNNPTQAAMLETVDKSTAAILEKLKELKLEENTIVVLFSDNGQLGTKEGKPFRGSKGDLYEGGIRMPLIIKWPDVIKPGGVCEEIVISNDFFPTFSEIAGTASQAKDIDGISILPVLKQPDAELKREAVYWHFPHYHNLGLGPQGAIRMGRYKLIEWFEKSAYGEADAYELYDLINDPGEQNNLADTMPEVTASLKGKLTAWREQVGAQMMTRPE